MDRELASSRIRRTLAALVSVSFVALSLAACEQDLRAADYQQSCNKDSDCVAILEGQPTCCGLHDCDDNAAINKVDLQQYLSDYDAATSGCGDTVCPEIACKRQDVGCVSGKCSLVRGADTGSE